MKIKNPFASLTFFEWILWGTSIITIIISSVWSSKSSLLEAIASLIGVTALIFVAKGFIIGQALTVVFSIFYGIVSLKFNYYGEMITYMFMSAPIALIATIEWIRHPYKNTEVVEVNRITKKQMIMMSIIGVITTFVFYFILKKLNTPNLFFSTLSVATSFAAAYLTYLRSPLYGIAYGLNDIVLIVLWLLASIDDITYLPMVACFLMFLANDVYGFINWQKIRKNQCDSIN